MVAPILSDLLSVAGTDTEVVLPPFAKTTSEGLFSDILPENGFAVFPIASVWRRIAIYVIGVWISILAAIIVCTRNTGILANQDVHAAAL